ncbi:universal stress protein [Aurantibacter crassamenti]|uniref:universal stress protein n=1 Tax=Aurantibacter crassamenti TaxID=1837375 RepID=UPI00193A8886|nr:universal stress protein [Aurantibacter crassamenti]MBM1106568.1 universal stress protein [Aurantibacter crassamenti]
MKSILYATDCSKHDTDTLQYAFEMCQQLKASLTLLHIYSIPPVHLSTIRSHKHLTSNIHDEQLKVLKDYATKQLAQSSNKVEINFEVVENISVSEGILSKIEEVSPDILLVGMKDEHTARGVFSGSIAKALLESVNCSLLIVPSNIKFKNIGSILYASDFEEDDIIAIEKLVELAQPFNAKINIVHIAAKDEYPEEQLMEWFKELLQQKVTYQKISFEVISNDKIYEGLRNYISTNNPDIIALLEREEIGFFNKLFHKDLTKKFESNISIPMLTFNQAYL